MHKIDIKTLLGYERAQVWNLRLGRYELTLSNGNKVTTTSRRIIFSNYIWDIHRRYPKLPVTEEHLLIDGKISTSNYLDILSAIYRDWYFTYHDDPNEDIEELWYLIYQTTNTIYNEFISSVDDYVETLSAIDFLDVVKNPSIRQANNDVKPAQSSIDDAYEQISDTLRDGSVLKENAIAKAVRSSLVDMNQVLQCVGPRGFTTEINSKIYKDPIMVGYAHGMRKIEDALKESRSAVKALMYASGPLSICEYFNRKLQLVAQNIRNIYKTDCGSRHTIDWEVRLEDLKSLDGMYYYDHCDRLCVIHKEDRHLNGHTIRLRTPFGCIHPDRQGICSTCAGQTSLSIPKGTNLGHVAAIAIGEKISQLVLSTKHVEGSSKVDDIEVDEEDLDYIHVGSDGNSYTISPNIRNEKLKMRIKRSEISLPDIKTMTDVEEIDPIELSAITEVTLFVGEPGSDGLTHEVTIPVSRGSRYASFSKPMLVYLKNTAPIEFTEKNDYLIDLEYFDRSLTLFELPLKHRDMLEYQNQIETMIFSNDDKKRDTRIRCLSTFKDTELSDALRYLMNAINSKLKINMTHISLIALAMAIRDQNPLSLDYRFPKGGESFSFQSLNVIMSYRSLGVKMAYQDQPAVVKYPENYINSIRPSHPQDELIKTPSQR